MFLVHSQDILDKKFFSGRFGGYVDKKKSIIENTCIFFIKIYQYIFSSWFPPCCRFYPSCSQYAIQAIQKYGLGTGVAKSVKRILRCNPWNKGGYDPVV